MSECNGVSKSDNIQSIFEKLKRNCLIRDLIFPDEVYYDEIDNAIEVVNERRRYTPTKEKPFEDKYNNLIYKMALYAITKIGAEGETSHQENGIYRTYQSSTDYPEDLLNQIIPYVGVVK